MALQRFAKSPSILSGDAENRAGKPVFLRKILDKFVMVVLAVSVLAGVGIYGTDFVRKWRVRGAMPITTEPMYVFRVLDPDGKPVVGARVASGIAGIGQGREYYWWGRGERLQIVTDDDGYARVPASLLAMSFNETGTPPPLYVCHESRELVAIVSLKNQPLDKPFDIDVVPGCRVSVVTRAGAFNFRGTRDMNGGVYVKWGLQPASPILQGGYSAQGLLPPGPYVIDTFSSFTAGSTQSFDVAIGQKQMAVRVEGDDEANTRLAGQVVPALEDIRAWSTTPTTLEELRGYVVILHFWSVTDDNAATTLQSLARLQRRFYSSGVRVVTIHDSTLDDGRALDTMLRRLSENVFEGLPVPFTVGLDTDDVFELEDGVKAYGRNIAAYGGLQTLLVDRKGVVLRKLDLAQPQTAGAYVYSALTGETNTDAAGGTGIGGQLPPPERLGFPRRRE